MKENVIQVGNEKAVFYIAGCRADYYVTRMGDVYSYSHAQGLIKKRKPDYCGHKYPTVRIKVYENNLVVTKNIPLYRIVYEAYIDRTPNWSCLGVKYKDGDSNNVSVDNLLTFPRGEDALLASISCKCCQYELEYRKNFNRVVDHVRWFRKLPLTDSEDIAQESYMYAALNYDSSKGDFRNFWIAVALKRAKSRWEYGRLISLDEEDYTARCENEEDLTFLFKLESLTESERWWLSFILQGYTREDILKKPHMRSRRGKIVLKDMFNKIKAAFGKDEL